MAAIDLTDLDHGDTRPIEHPTTEDTLSFGLGLGIDLVSLSSSPTSTPPSLSDLNLETVRSAESKMI